MPTLLLLLDIRCGAFEMAREIGCAGVAKRSSTSRAPRTTPSRFAGGVTSAFASSLGVAVEQQPYRSSDSDMPSPLPSTPAKA